MVRTLLLLLVVTVASAAAQDSTAVAQVDPNGWVQDLAIADKLLAAGYLDTAQADYEKIIRLYPQTVPGVSRAWVGIAKIHTSRGQLDLAKTSIESVFQLNNDAEAMAAARTSYRQMKDAADAQVSSAMQMTQFLEYRYQMTPWYDLLNKLFTYLDLRSARKQLDTATSQANGYDPHYLIDVGPLPAVGAAMQISSTEFAPATGAAVHTPATATSEDPAVPPAVAPTPAPTTTAGTGGTAATAPQGTGSSTPAVVSRPSPAPVDQLVVLQRGYQDAYRKLQDAISKGNQTTVLEANKAYQAALEAYRKAAAASR